MTVTVTHTFVNPVDDDPTFTGVKPSHWNAVHTVEGLGTAAELDVGTSDGDVVQVQTGGKLPALDGSDLTNLPSGGSVPSGGTTGQALVKASNADGDTEWSTVEGTGSVTSVAATVPTGFAISGSPVTTSGTFAITYDTGYEGFTTTLKDKINGVEASADVTDATNVAAAGAVMDGDFSADGMMARTASGAYASRTITGTSDQITVSNGDGKSGNPTLALATAVTTSLGKADTAVQPGDLGTAAPLDIDTDDTLSANSDTLIPTQQAVKAYVDANGGGGSGLWRFLDYAIGSSGSDQTTGGSGNYDYASAPGTAPTTSKAYRADSKTVSCTAAASGKVLRFNYAGSGQYSFSRINGTQVVKMVAALYRDSDANAIAWAVCTAATITSNGTGAYQDQFGFNVTFLIESADTSAHTYHMRFVSTTAPTGQGTCASIHNRIFTVEEEA